MSKYIIDMICNQLANKNTITDFHGGKEQNNFLNKQILENKL